MGIAGAWSSDEPVPVTPAAAPEGDAMRMPVCWLSTSRISLPLIAGPLAVRASRRIMFSSSRTLPGKGCARSSALASSDRLRSGSPCAAARASRCAASGRMSSTRARSGGTLTVTPASR